MTDTMDAQWVSKPATQDELDELRDLIEFRPGVMSEALSQRSNLAGHFCAMMGISARSHPATFLLASVAEMVGLFVVMYYKARYGRARPSRLSPLLRPPIAVPTHAAYPSGHATQSFLIAHMLADALPSPIKQRMSDAQALRPPAAATSLPCGGPLFRLAERIARNREVMGLHYPSDTTAGLTLAGLVKTMLLNTLGDLKDPANFNTSAGSPVISAGVPYDLKKKVEEEWTNDAP